MSENYFNTLNGINVNDKTEKKNGLTYLSWAWAWGEVKKLYPDSNYAVYENAQGWNYHTDGRTAWVKTGVTVNGIEHVEMLPVMDTRNHSIPLDKITSFDVNKAIQRSLTKAVARHGLGLYIYAGEDLPEEETKAAPAQKPAEKPAEKPAAKPAQKLICECCGKEITGIMVNGKAYTPFSVAKASQKNYGKLLCYYCAAEQKIRAEKAGGRTESSAPTEAQEPARNDNGWNEPPAPDDRDVPPWEAEG